MKKTTMALFVLSACVYHPSQELLTARNAYSTAEQSQNAALVPKELESARTSLTRAEKMDKDDPGSRAAKDQAYIAQRRAEFAQARGVTLQQMQMRDATDRNYTALARENAALLAARPQPQVQPQQMQVIRVSSAVAFDTGKADLHEEAMGPLDNVVDQLKRTNRPIVIIGNTDSTGSSTKNRKLSQERADAVKDYLVDHGIDASRIEARGVGSSRPLANNTTATGRAQNRRVDIIVQPRTGTAGVQPR
jgi:outer membrane protein OmpA-like peptidoglycan-associated protein